MTYESLVLGDDEILVTIHDGEGGECLSSIEHSTKYFLNQYKGMPTIHQRCTSVLRSMSVKVLDFEVSGNEESMLKRLPLQLIIACVFAVVVILFFSVGLPIYHWNKAREGLPAPKKKKPKDRKKVSKKTKHKEDTKGNETGKVTKKRVKGKAPKKKPEGGNKAKGTKQEEKSVEQKTDKSKAKSSKATKQPSRLKSPTKTAATYDEPPEIDVDMTATTSIVATPARHESANNSAPLESEIEWLQYLDESTGDYYYELIRTGEVTWTEPADGKFINEEEL